MMGGYAGGQARVRARAVRRRRPDEDSRRICPTSRCCSCPTSSRPATWRRRTATSSRATRSRCGAAAPSASSRSQSAWMLGAERVIAIDRVRSGCVMAADTGQGGDVINLRGRGRLRRAQGDDRRPRSRRVHRRGRHGGARQRPIDDWYDKAKTAMFLATDRPHALRQAIHACRKGGTVSIPGVYGGFIDKVPIGAAFGKGLTLKMGQTHVHRYMQPLLERIAARRDRSVVRRSPTALRLDDAPQPTRCSATRQTSASRW